jgi:hypothetical protein
MLILPYMLNYIILWFIHGIAIALCVEYSIMESAVVDVSSMTCKNISDTQLTTFILKYEKLSSDIFMIYIV